MTRHRRPPIVLLASAMALALLVVEFAAAAPVVPTVPTVPSLPTIPGSVKARFTVVVEGTATSSKDMDGGAVAPCRLSIQGHVDQTSTYRRGKGVVLEFVRLGPGSRAPVLIRRSGRSADASVALKVTTTQTASGTATRDPVPEVPLPACAPLAEDLSKGPDCGKASVDDATARFIYSGSSGVLQLRLSDSATIGFSEPDCPESTIVPDLSSLYYGWPTPVAFDRMNLFFPQAAIFGKKKVLVDSFASPQKTFGPQSVTLGTLARLTVTNRGRNRLKVRLIRLP